MEPPDQHPRTAESLADIAAAVAAARQSMPSVTQLARWRSEGLLPKARQVSNAFHGSVVEYPLGTSRQIVEIQRLLKIKEKFDFVGWELWWAGFPVDDIHWRPILENAAQRADRLLRACKIFMWRQDKTADDIVNNPTSAFDNITNIPMAGNLFSRIAGRLKNDEIGQLLRILTEVGAGVYSNSVTSADCEDHNLLVRALDIQDSRHHNPRGESHFRPGQNHVVLGKRLNLPKQMPSVFSSLSGVLGQHQLKDILECPQAEIEIARTDFRNSLKMAADLYESLKDVFGERALGLRLLSWIERHQTKASRSMGALLFAMLRRHGSVLLASSEIDAMTVAATKMRVDSLKFMAIVKSDLGLARLVSAKALRLAFSDADELELLKGRVRTYVTSRPVRS